MLPLDRCYSIMSLKSYLMRINLNVRPQLRYLVQRKWSIMLDNCTTNRRKKFELFSQFYFINFRCDCIAKRKRGTSQKSQGTSRRRTKKEIRGTPSTCKYWDQNFHICGNFENQI